MAPYTRQQKRLYFSEDIRMTRSKAAKEQFSSSSSLKPPPNCSKRRRATTKRKQSPPPPNKAEESNVKAALAVAEHNDNNSKIDRFRRPGWASYIIKYFSVPKDLAIKYSAQTKASDDFDVDNSLNGYRSMGGRILPIEYEPGFSIEDDKDLHKYAKKALASFIYNNKNERNLKFHRVVKANQKGGPVYWWYYITFEATNADNQIKTLQTKVSQKFTGKVRIKIESGRLKPIPTPTSAPESDRR